jgi:hypothetical protein
MPRSIKVKPKKRGRPATGKDPLIGIRAPPELIAKIDRYAEHQALTRSEAIRKLLEHALKAKGQS